MVQVHIPLLAAFSLHHAAMNRTMRKPARIFRDGAHNVLSLLHALAAALDSGFAGRPGALRLRQNLSANLRTEAPSGPI